MRTWNPFFWDQTSILFLLLKLWNPFSVLNCHQIQHIKHIRKKLFPCLPPTLSLALPGLRSTICKSLPSAGRHPRKLNTPLCYPHSSQPLRSDINCVWQEVEQGDSKGLWFWSLASEIKTTHTHVALGLWKYMAEISAHTGDAICGSGKPLILLCIGTTCASWLSGGLWFFVSRANEEPGELLPGKQSEKKPCSEIA